MLHWAKFCLRQRSPQSLQVFSDLLSVDTSDWRSRFIVIRHTSADPPEHLRDCIARLVQEILYKRRWSVPIPSKFRGCFESLVENLLLCSIHDIGGQVPELLYGQDREPLSDTLAPLRSDDAIWEPDIVDRWRAERRARAAKHLIHCNAHRRGQKLWIRAQASFSTYKMFCGLMAQNGFSTQEEAVAAAHSALSIRVISRLQCKFR